MKKVYTLFALVSVLTLCSCVGTEHTDTEFLFDTVVTLTASCERQTLDGAFLLCRNFEDTLSAQKKGSEIYSLNENGKNTVSDDTARLLKRGLYYSKLTDGKFDITIYSVSSLWDFKNEVIPSRDEISAALKNVCYDGVDLNGNVVKTSGQKIDLGAIAKGYIADKVLDYFKENGVKKGIINLGGNVVVFGDKEYNVGIKKPFSDNEICATLKLKNKSVATSGVYERCFKKDGTLYHHVLDTKTGYPVNSDLLSVSIVNDSSCDGDALSTVCLILGKEEAKKLIENTENTEAVFVDSKGNVSFTSGLCKKGAYIVYK